MSGFAFEYQGFAASPSWPSRPCRVCRLTHSDDTASIGEGGMRGVYRSSDTKLWLIRIRSIMG